MSIIKLDMFYILKESILKLKGFTIRIKMQNNRMKINQETQSFPYFLFIRK